MEKNAELALEFSENTLAMIEEYSRLTGCNEEEVVENIIHEFLMNQLPLIQKRASESGKSLNVQVNEQFTDVLEFLLNQAKNQAK